MKCKHLQIQLPEYIRGTTDPLVRKEIVDHIAHCAECASRADELTMLFRELGKMRQPQPPPEQYWQTILPRVHERLSQGRRPYHVVRDLIPVALSLALVCMVVFLFHVPADVSLQGLGERLRDAQPEELQMIADQQTVTGFTEASFSTDEQDLQATDDQLSLMKILSGREPVFSTGTDDSYIPVENLSDQELEKIAATVDLSSSN